MQQQQQPHNLPAPLTSFIGREKELAELKTLLLSHRLLTLTGAGGVGKTRLAQQLAFNTLDFFRDGAWFVDLAPLTSPALLIPTLLNTLGLPESEELPAIYSLREQLRKRELLLLMDNCEHLIVDCAALVTDLLRTAPSLYILTTSREALRVEGETIWRVPSLSLPPVETLPSAVKQDPGKLEEYEATRLFCDRARSILPSFKLEEFNCTAVVQICRQLDGIPLALELAAARLRLLKVEEIAAKLNERFQLLSFTNRSLLPRQQTLKALVDWSYNLLSPQEQTLLNRLSTFKGGWTLAAAHFVADAGTGTEIEPRTEAAYLSAPVQFLNLMQELIEKSLVMREETTAPFEGERERPGERARGGGAESRYCLLETIREYAEEKLVAAGEIYQIKTRHLAYFVGLAEEALPHLRGPEQVKWLNLLEQEQDNFRAALNFARQAGPTGAEKLVRLTAAIWPFWHTRGYLVEGSQWLQLAVELSESTLIPVPVPVSVTVNLRARILNGAGVLAHTFKNYPQAQAFQQQSLHLFQELGDQAGIATATNDLGWLALYQLQIPEALSLGEKSLQMARELKDRPREVTSLLLLGVAARLAGNNPQARKHFEQSLKMARELGDIGSMAAALGGLVRITSDEGEYDKSKEFIIEVLFLRYQEGNKMGLFLCIAGLAIAGFRFGHPLQAARLLGASEVILKAAGSPIPSIWGGTLEELKAALLPERVEALEQALKEGQEMPFSQIYTEAKALANSLTAPAAAPALAPAAPSTGPVIGTSLPDRSQAGEGIEVEVLTAREKEVLRLVAKGLTNVQIADQLVISPRTVHAHLRTIFSKLSVTTRSAAARYALKLGLL